MVSTPAASRPAPGSRRDTLLRVAADLIAASGYAGTSLRDVADAAGIQAGSIYHHFESKDSLAVAIAEAQAERWREQLAKANKEVSDPLAGS